REAVRMRFSLVLVLVVALSEGCGRVSGSVGGQDIPPGRWPWFAHLYYQQNLLCSGSLISDQWVLTEANCFQGANISAFTVVLGRTNQTGSDPNEVSRGINQTVCHPLSNQETSDNNICLVQLSSPVELSDHISPVCLAAENSTFPNGTFSWITGNNLDDNKELSALQLQILGNTKCQDRFFITITDNMICTRYDPPMEQPCITTGAPLLIRNNDLVWIQLGVSTTGQICRKNFSPPLFTRVSRYQEWIIQSVTGS
uniref:Peptidase S1 domain-containing protein n=1 Tax=Tetraodon nigroviridis TaxID=99883 RepID=H3CIE6_TETNG